MFQLFGIPVIGDVLGSIFKGVFGGGGSQAAPPPTPPASDGIKEYLPYIGLGFAALIFLKILKIF